MLALFILAALAAGYQLFALIACLEFRFGRRTIAKTPRATGVSILKPVRGAEPALRSALASHVALSGEVEILCGVRDLSDAAVSLLREFPSVRIIECKTAASNGKVGTLIDLARAARYPVLIVNDADIRVDPDYIERVLAPLADSEVGLVTCLYRPEGDTLAARFESLGVATDFAPSALVARLVGVDEFAMGSTLAFRRRELERIGGFESIAEYLADDYQLGRRIRALGLKCVLSDVVVTTWLSGNWGQVWRHQIRWARAIRVSRFWGYVGLPITFATFWSFLLAFAGEMKFAGILLVIRMAMALAAGGLALRHRDTLLLAPLIPVRDLFAAAVWSAGLFGTTVEWRGLRLRLRPDGRIEHTATDQITSAEL
jgi:ceramide glucosyltransferase